MNLKSINRYCHKGHIIQEITATQCDTGITITHNSKTNNVKEKIQWEIKRKNAKYINRF